MHRHGAVAAIGGVEVFGITARCGIGLPAPIEIVAGGKSRVVCHTVADGEVKGNNGVTTL